ncbi:hypothetical protein HJG60_011467 [Phyllostomus discolor]|uniref:Uncharacterized protein n=1 Tax=Phyllostomus discolor TaxID=89673 RepID=A0A834E0S1_9CHIR|nr:hypothetical protein HJG60_011467 [Phyllostomus discolor]
MLKPFANPSTLLPPPFLPCDILSLGNISVVSPPIWQNPCWKTGRYLGILECPLTSEWNFSTQKTLASLSEDEDKIGISMSWKKLDVTSFIWMDGLSDFRLYLTPESLWCWDNHIYNKVCLFQIHGYLYFLRTKWRTGIFRITITYLQG